MNTSLFAYLETLKSRPLLSRSEEADLVRRAQAGHAMQANPDALEESFREQVIRDGKAAEATLAESFLHKIVQQARLLHDRSGGRGAVEDLVSAGNEGLLKGIQRFDLSRGTRFWTYAFWWVKDGMSKEIRFWRWPLAISDDAYRKTIKIMGTSNRFWQDTGDLPTVQELAAALGWNVERLQTTMHYLSLNDVLSIEMVMGEAGQATLADFLIDQRGMYGSDPNLVGSEDDSVSSEASTAFLKETVRYQLGLLPPKEREVLSLRFGLLDGRSRTLKEVGDSFGVSSERARQIEAQALSRLRHGESRAMLEPLIR